MPSSMNRCCQRQTRVFDVPVWRMISSDTVGAQKHDVRSPNVLLRGVTTPGDRFKPMAIRSYDLDGNPGACARLARAPTKWNS